MKCNPGRSSCNPRQLKGTQPPPPFAAGAASGWELQIESFLPGLRRPGRLGLGYASQREIPNTRNAPRADDQDEAVDGEAGEAWAPPSRRPRLSDANRICSIRGVHHDASCAINGADAARYNATLFLRMLRQRGGLATAKYLINSSKESNGYTELFLRKRLDLTVEAMVVENKKWHELFTNDDLTKARLRLTKHGYAPKVGEDLGATHRRRSAVPDVVSYSQTSTDGGTK
jgi:hypothetical protein